MSEQENDSQELIFTPISFRAQLLRELYNRALEILEIHCNGCLLIFSEEFDELYIHIKRAIEGLINSIGFEDLRRGFNDLLPQSLHSLGSDADGLWDYLNNDLRSFKGEIIEFCISHKASFGSEEKEKKFKKDLEDFDEIIDKHRIQKTHKENDWLKKSVSQLTSVNGNETKRDYINRERIYEIESITSRKYDFKRLVGYLNEINLCFENKCLFAVAMLTRAIIDHVPPLFGFSTFGQIFSNYTDAGRSFRESMEHLEKSSRKIADSFLHNHIRAKESLPNENQINFSNDLDVLLAEICRISKVK